MNGCGIGVDSPSSAGNVCVRGSDGGGAGAAADPDSLVANWATEDDGNWQTEDGGYWLLEA